MKCPNCPNFDLIELVDPNYHWCEICGGLFELNEEGLDELDVDDYYNSDEPHEASITKESS